MVEKKQKYIYIYNISNLFIYKIDTITNLLSMPEYNDKSTQEK